MAAQPDQGDPGRRGRSAARLGHGDSLGCQLRAGFGDRSARREADFLTGQYALVCALSGGGVYSDELVGERSFGPGSVIQRFPHRRHCLHYRGPSRIAWLAVPSATLDLLRVVGLPADDEPVFELAAHHDVERVVDDIAAALSAADAWELPSVLSRMVAFVVDIHARRRRDGAQRAMESACALLADGLAAPAVAVRMGMGYHAFRKRFRAEHGIAPDAYRIRRRIERAMAILQDTDRSIASIAEELGYCDAFAFSRQFRRVVGSSPSRWRLR